MDHVLGAQLKIGLPIYRQHEYAADNIVVAARIGRIQSQRISTGGPLEMVFIRAPRITEVGDRVEVLARRDGAPILVRERNVLAATFHPELSEDRRIHRYFIQMVEEMENKGHPAQPKQTPATKPTQANL